MTSGGIVGAEVRDGVTATDQVAESAAEGDTHATGTQLRPDAPVASAPGTTEGATVIDLRSGDPIIRLEPAAPIRSRAASRYVRVIKPAVDRLVGALALVVVSPLLAVVALGIRVTMGKGVFFHQPRVGKDGEVFDVVKFRTMNEDRRLEQVSYVGPERRANHKSVDDPRHTAFGRFLRKWSLDEFPQFINVVRGDMSLVGPRPELVSVVERYQPWQHERHQVRPGITGIWQVSERGDIPLHEATHLDIEYVETVSAWTDLKIVAKTVPAMLGRSRGQ